LSTFSALGVNQTLLALVTGESMLNDAVAIVIFRVAAAAARQQALAELNCGKYCLFV
jgi:NhaP-type Na+/H+ or K+/H+ antiporter